MNLFHEAKKVLDKDGKVNPLGPYGKQKLTGREISAYFRRNPVKDATIRKAVSVALDLEGAMTTAAKEIKKFYGDKVLKSKEVQFALKYANEGVIHEYDDISEGSFYGRDDLVKQFATPKNKRHLYIKLRKTDSKGTHGVSMARKGNEDKIKKYKADGYKEVPVESVEESLQESLILLEKAYDANDVKKVQQLEKKFKALLKEVDKVMRGSGISAPAFSMVRGGIRKGLESIEKFYKIANAPKNLKNESINEVTDKEIMAMRKVSKDMQNVLKSYQKIATMGDKELKNTKHNYDYEQVLKARDTIVSMIGKLQTRQTIEKSMKKESYSIADTYRVMNDHDNDEFLKEGKVLKFTNIKDKTLEKHLKAVTKKVGAKLEKISGGFAVSDTDMRGFTAVVDYIFDKSIKKNMLDGGGMSDVTMANENAVMSAPQQNMSKIKPMLTKLASKHKKVKVSFGTHSKGKFVDDNNINFNGDKKDIDMLMKDIQKNKSLMKMMESPKLDVMDTFRDMMTEKVSYVEYKFKNKNDAQKAMDMFKRNNLMSFDINDDNLNGGELAVDAGNKDMTKYHKQVMQKFKPKIQMSENYRKLAQKGMGTETKKDARVGLELDYYDSKGNKHMGKIVKKSATGYTVQDDKTRKTHTFKFHDRVDAKKLLAASNEFDKNPLKGFPYN